MYNIYVTSRTPIFFDLGFCVHSSNGGVISALTYSMWSILLVARAGRAIDAMWRNSVDIL